MCWSTCCSLGDRGQSCSQRGWLCDHPSDHGSGRHQGSSVPPTSGEKGFSADGLRLAAEGSAASAWPLHGSGAGGKISDGWAVILNKAPHLALKKRPG